MKCVETGCGFEASHVPQLFVPPTGYPAEEGRSVSMILNAPMCRRHCEGFKVEQLLDVPNEMGATLRKDLIPALTRAMTGSPVPPDCDRAWVTPLRMNSDAYRDFMKAAGRDGAL